MDGKKPWEEEYHVDAPGDVCLGHTAVAVVLDPESDPEIRTMRAKMFAKSSEMAHLLRMFIPARPHPKTGAFEHHTRLCWEGIYAYHVAAGQHVDPECAHICRVLREIGAIP